MIDDDANERDDADNGESATEIEGKGPRPAKPFCDMLLASEKAFQVWNQKCDTIDKLYADLSLMASTVGDREMKIFWANMEVLRPTIYQRAPQPVATARKRGGKNNALPKELVNTAAEILEGALHYDVDADDLHETLLLVRDDLAINGRGVPWVLDNGSAIHVDRGDFLTDPARKWPEVGWVARRAYLTHEEIEERFPDADLRMMTFAKVKSDDEGKSDYRSTDAKAQVWEIWHKAEQKVLWVMHDYPDVLDERDPMVNVAGFFPCPKPAYATVERRTLKPVPDFVYYRDQVDEINELTGRIASLSESLRLKGFYASGTSEIGEAIEAAMRATDDKAVLVPVSNFAALGGGNLKDAIVWLPVDQVAKVITDLVALRRQLIEDVYEISGLSDIMRGSTQASETATAQNLKAQYGSVRVRERQAEMVRVARDVIRIKAEIFAETVPTEELCVMAQVKVQTAAEVQQKAMMAQQQGQQIDLSKEITLEQIDALLKNERTRPFVLDIESDSTIAPNEEAEKASRIEFVTAIGGFVQQAGAMVVQQPETAPFAAEVLKFAASSFRGGRELMGAVDEFAEMVSATGKQAAQAKQQAAQQPNPEQLKAQAEQQKMQVEQQGKQADMQLRAQQAQVDAAAKAKELALKEREIALKERAQSHAEMTAQRQTDAVEGDVNRLANLEQLVAQSTAQMAQAVQILTQQMSALADTVTAPRRVIRGPDGSVQGVEILSAQPTTRTVERDAAGNIAGVDRLN